MTIYSLRHLRCHALQQTLCVAPIIDSLGEVHNCVNHTLAFTSKGDSGLSRKIVVQHLGKIY